MECGGLAVAFEALELSHQLFHCAQLLKPALTIHTMDSVCTP